MPKNQNNSKKQKKSSKPKKVRLAPRRVVSRVVRAPAAQSRVNVARPAAIRSTNNQVCVKHRELVSLVDATLDAFPLTSLRINPANASLFPWLSQMSMQWETYKFKKLHFVFVSNSSTANNGSLTMSLDYDVLDAPPPSVQAMISMPNAISGPLWAGNQGMLVYKAASQNLSKMKSYFIADAVPAGADAKTYDVGTFFISASASGTAVPRVGQLWVDYEVDFFTPQLPDGQTNGTETLLKVAGIQPESDSPTTLPLLGVIGNIINKQEFQRETVVQQFNTLFTGVATALLLNWVRPVIVSTINGLFVKIYLWMSQVGPSLQAPDVDDPPLKTVALRFGYTVPSGVGTAVNMIASHSWFVFPSTLTTVNNAGYYEGEFYLSNAIIAAITDPPFPKDMGSVWYCPILVGSTTGDAPTNVQIDTYSVPAPLLTLRETAGIARNQAYIDNGFAAVESQNITTVIDGSAVDFFANASFSGTVAIQSYAGSVLELKGFLPGYYYMYWFLEHPTLLTTPDLVLNDAGGSGTPAVFSTLANVVNTATYFKWASILIGPDSNPISLELDTTTFTGTADATLSIIPLLA